MADDDKTEEPTSKKIDDARNKGNVPKSQDVSSFITLFVSIALILMLFPYMREHVLYLAQYYFSLMGMTIDRASIVDISVTTVKEIFLIIMPLTGAVAVAGVIAAVSQFGFLFTTQAIEPKFSKLNPISGIKNLLSPKKLVDGVKIMLKSFSTLGIGFLYFFYFILELPTVALLNLGDQLDWLVDKALIIVAVMLFIFFLFAFVDLIITRKRYFDGLKMSKQEVTDEHKNADGDPKIKAKIRQKQMEMATKRMMAEVPKADVVITNPTHYAVALKYEEDKRAPVVVAKGMDSVALQIKEIARENNVPVVQNPPLARSLYAEVEIDRPIPDTLFAAVAEVLAYVYNMNK